MIRSRPASIFARFVVLVIAGYLSHVAEYVMSPGDRMILAVPGLDARPLFFVTTLVAVAYAFAPELVPLRWAWLILVTFCAWGRAVSLLVIGSSEIDRAREFAGFLSWFLVWAAAVLATFVLTAGQLLRHDRG